MRVINFKSISINDLSQLPLVLENCTFHKPAMKWTIKYLVENLQDENHTAYFSTNR